VAFVGGFNIAPEYDGDGVTRAGGIWAECGRAAGGAVAATFEDMLARADFQHKRFTRWRKTGARQMLLTPNEQLLLSGPGRERSPLKRALREIWRGRRRCRSWWVFSSDLEHPKAVDGHRPRGGSVELISGGQIGLCCCSHWRGRVCIAGCCGPGSEFTNMRRRFCTRSC